MVQKRIDLFSKEPYHPSLENHKLGGTLKEARAFKINRDIRIVFTMTKNGVAFFNDIGDPDDVY